MKQWIFQSLVGSLERESVRHMYRTCMGQHNAENVNRCLYTK